MTLLSTVQSACRLLSLVSPSAVAASTDQQVIQLMELANEEGRELSRRHNWRKITKEQTFTSVDQEAQTGAIPSDFDRFIDGTWWDRTSQRPLVLIDEIKWQTIQANPAAGRVWLAFRLRGNDFLITPSPGAGKTIAFEYVSTQWVDTDSDNAGDAEVYSSDTDVSLLPERLIALGIRWRFLEAKGLDYAEPYRTYETEVIQAIARDKGMPVISASSSWKTTAYPVPDVIGVNLSS